MLVMFVEWGYKASRHEDGKLMKPCIYLTVIIGMLAGLQQIAAQTWTQSIVASTNWWGVSSSADGSVLFATVGNTNIFAIYISTNSGVTWVPTTPPMTNSRFVVAVSADGNTVFAARSLPASNPWNTTNSDPFFLSTNSGATWSSLMGSITNRSGSVAISADGRTLIGGMQPGWIYISTNSGAAWTSNQLGNGAFSIMTVFSSADGGRLSAMFGIYSPCTFWTTTNSGVTWVQYSLPGLGYNWDGFASSADGNKWIAVGYYNNGPTPAICISTNAGVSWNARTVSLSGEHSFGSVASSADGTKLAVSGKGIYSSTNSGATWMQTAAPNTNWNYITSSSDGGKLAATVDVSFAIPTASGGIWTSQTTQSPQLNITPTNDSFKLSWLIPSTNFVMRQSSDLQIWADVTNQPVLNPATLHDEVILSPPGSSVFYQLKTP